MAAGRREPTKGRQIVVETGGATEAKYVTSDALSTPFPDPTVVSEAKFLGLPL